MCCGSTSNCAIGMGRLRLDGHRAGLSWVANRRPSVLEHAKIRQLCRTTGPTSARSERRF